MSYGALGDVRLSERLQYVEQTIGDSLAKHAQDQRDLLCSDVTLGSQNESIRSWRMPGRSWATCMRECRSARRGGHQHVLAAVRAALVGPRGAHRLAKEVECHHGRQQGEGLGHASLQGVLGPLGKPFPSAKASDPGQAGREARGASRHAQRACECPREGERSASFRLPLAEPRGQLDWKSSRGSFLDGCASAGAGFDWGQGGCCASGLQGNWGL